MKIADPRVIETGEKNLISAIREDLNMDTVWQILKEQISISSLSHQGGEIVVHDNQIAFKLDFDLKFSGSLLFDRKGTYIDLASTKTLQSPEMEEAFEPADFGREDPLTDPQNSHPKTGLEAIDLDEPELNEEISIDLPEFDLGEEIESESEMELTDPIPEDPQAQEEMLDDDINDILQESRDFWDQKKE